MEGRVGRVAKGDTRTLGVADFLASKQGQGGLLLGFQVASQLPYSQINNPVYFSSWQGSCSCNTVSNTAIKVLLE